MTNSLGREPRRLQPGRTDLLVEPGNRRFLPDRDPDAAVQPGLAGLAAERADHRRAPAAPRRCLAAWPGSIASAAMPWSASTTSSRWSRSTRPRRIATSAVWPPTSNKILAANAKYLPKGYDHRAARPGTDHEQRLLRPAVRPARRDRADLPADRGQLPVLERSVRDRHRAARRARRHRLDAVRHAHHAVGARADRCDHVHGRGHGQLDPGGQLLPRAARRARRRGRRPRWKPASSASVRC